MFVGTINKNIIVFKLHGKNEIFDSKLILTTNGNSPYSMT